ncbi:MAG: hypothetical protein ACYTF5_22340, partial [Planctomycetota bacterium]
MNCTEATTASDTTASDTTASDTRATDTGATDTGATGTGASAGRTAAATKETATATTDAAAENQEGIELVAGLPSGDLERCLLQANRHTEVGHRLLAFYLNEVQQRGVHQLWGYSSAVHYAVERLDMHRRKAQMLVAVGATLLRLRAIDRAFAEGEIT